MFKDQWVTSYCSISKQLIHISGFWNFTWHGFACSFLIVKSSIHQLMCDFAGSCSQTPWIRTSLHKVHSSVSYKFRKTYIPANFQDNVIIFKWIRGCWNIEVMERERTLFLFNLDDLTKFPGNTLYFELKQ